MSSEYNSKNENIKLELFLEAPLKPCNFTDFLDFFFICSFISLARMCLVVFSLNLSFAVVQSLSYVWLFATHGLQHARLPCPSLSPRVCIFGIYYALWTCGFLFIFIKFGRFLARTFQIFLPAPCSIFSSSENLITHNMDLSMFLSSVDSMFTFSSNVFTFGRCLDL